MKVLDSYARESARGDKRDLSITGQHDVNLTRIKELGARLGLKLQDKGRSAWKKGVERPDWERMVNRLESGESDGAVIYDLERLLRRVEDALRIVKLAERGLEKGFRIYDSDMEYDLTTASGQKAFYDAAVAGQAFSHRLSGKVSRGNRKKAANGEGKPGRHRAFGFENDSTTVRESEREPIRQVVDMVLNEDATWQDAIDHLASLGIYNSSIAHTDECTEARNNLTRYQKQRYQCDCPPGLWVPETLKTALKSPRMGGYVRYGKDLLGRLPGEPILDPTVWQELLMMITSRRGRPPTDDALCTGARVPVRCWNCGGIIVIRDASHDKTYADAGSEFAKIADDPTEVRRHYKCNHQREIPGAPNQKGCGRILADRYVVDGIIGDMVIHELSSPESAETLALIYQEKNSARVPHDQEIARLEGLRSYWDGVLISGKQGLTPKRHNELVEDIETKILSERAALEEIGDVPDFQPVARPRSVVLEEWRAAAPAGRRDILRQAFGERPIYIMPGSSVDSRKQVGKRIKRTPRSKIPGRPQS